MTTVGQAVAEIAAELHGTQREELNTLAGAMTADGITLATTYDLEGIVRGAFIAIDDEVMYVWTSASKAATVRRGMLGTTAAAHDSGALITVNPAFPRGVIKRLMKEELRSWPAGVFSVGYETITASTSSRTTRTALSVPASDVQRILDVREQRDSTGGIGTRDSWPRIRHFEPFIGREGGDVLELQILQDLRGASVWVAYAKAFNLDTFADATSLTDTVGVPESCLDILRMGTAMRAIPSRELLRARQDAQGQPRDASEVQPGQNSQTAILYKTLRDQRLAEEAMRLREKWPTVGG